MRARAQRRAAPERRRSEAAARRARLQPLERVCLRAGAVCERRAQRAAPLPARRPADKILSKFGEGERARRAGLCAGPRAARPGSGGGA